jgi:hypothetical protein
MDDKLFDRTAASRRKLFFAKADAPHSNKILKALIKQNPKSAEIRTPEIMDFISKNCCLEVLAVTPIPRQGTFHLIHEIHFSDGPTRIIRTPAPKIFRQDPGPEIDSRIENWLGTISLPSARNQILRAGDLSPYEIQMMNVIEGRCLASFSDEEQDEAPLLKRLGKTLKKLHEISGTGAGLIDVEQPLAGTEPVGVCRSWIEHFSGNLEQHLDICLRIGVISHKRQGLITQLFNETQTLMSDRPLCLLHGDLNNHNIYLDGQTDVRLIDWEDALVGDPLYELAAWASFHPARRHSALLRGYGILPTLQGIDGILFAAYFLRIALAKTVHRYRFGISDIPGRPLASNRISWGLDALVRVINGKSGAIIP